MTNSVQAQQRSGRSPKERGIAILAATFALAFLTLLTTELSYNTNIDYASAANARDAMRAHFLARSGVNLSRLVIKVQKDIFDKYRRFLGDVQLADYVPMLVPAFGGRPEEVGAFADSIGGIDSSRIKGLGLPEGDFDLWVGTEDGKINVNCAGGSANTQKQLELMLSALVQPVAYDKLFEERDADGQFTDRATFVRAIIDWVDRDEAAYGLPGQSEEYGYESRPDQLEARNNYIDTPDELRLVRGMDARKWELFGPTLSAFGGCRVNVAATKDVGILAAILYQSAKEPNDPVLADPMKLWSLAAFVAQARAFGIMFEDTKQFAEFVKDPTAMFADVADSTEGGMLPLLPNGQPLVGLELDLSKLNQVARAGNRRTYRVEVTARIGRVEKTLRAVWDNDTHNQNHTEPAYARGSWVYWREE